MLQENWVKSSNSGKGIGKGSWRRWPFTGDLGGKKEADLWGVGGTVLPSRENSKCKSTGAGMSSSLVLERLEGVRAAGGKYGRGWAKY